MSHYNQVSENMQGLVDLNGGSYVHLSANVPLSRIFGDPCEVMTKSIRCVLSMYILGLC